MSDTAATVTDLEQELLQREESARTIIGIVTPLFETMLGDALSPVGDLVKFAEELRIARDELQTVKATYATRDDVKTIGQDIGKAIGIPLQTSIDGHLRGLTEEDAKRHNEFNQRIGETHALTLRNEQRIIAVENTTATQIRTLEERLTKLEQKTSENIHSIRRDTESVRNSATVLHNSVIQFINANKEYQAQTTSRIESLDQEQQQQQKRIDRNESVLQSESNIIRDIDGRVRDGMTRIEGALFGDAKEKKPGLVADMGTLKSGLWWQSWIGKHPRIALAAATTAYVIFLIVTAVILQRPEIIQKMIPTG